MSDIRTYIDTLPVEILNKLTKLLDEKEDFAIIKPDGTLMFVGDIESNDAIVLDAYDNLVGVAPSTAGNVFSSNGTAWVSQSRVKSGLDTDRPRASADIVGQFYFSTDARNGEGVLYKCISSTKWIVVGIGADKASFGPFSSSVIYCGSSAGVAPKCQSFALLFYIGSSLPLTDEIIFWRANVAGSRGLDIRIGGDAGDRGQLQVYSNGPATLVTPVGATVAGKLSQIHSIAGSWVDGNLRTSFDGGTVVASACAYTAPQATDVTSFGYHVSGGSNFFTKGNVAPFISFSDVVSDDDLRRLSGFIQGPVPSDYSSLEDVRFPKVAGTVDFHLMTSHIREGDVYHRIGDDLFIIGAPGTPGFLRKKSH